MVRYMSRTTHERLFKKYLVNLEYVDKGIIVNHESEMEAPNHIDAVAWTLHKVKWDGLGRVKNIAIQRID
jgi:hypothetical protein